MLATIVLSVLRSRAARRRLIVITAVCAVTGAAYALLAPKWYTSSITLVPASQSGGGLSGLLANSDVSSIADSAGMTTAADAARISAVLQSVGVTDALISEFDLRTRYAVSTVESARKALWAHCEVKVLPKPNLVLLTCEDKDAAFVQRLLRKFAEVGNQVFTRVSLEAAGEEVHFLEAHVDDVRRQADATGEAMRKFQVENHVVDLEVQSKAVVSAIASLQAQRINKQLELDYARTYASADEPSTRELRTQLSVMDQKMRELEHASSSVPSSNAKDGAAEGPSTGMFPAALAVPGLRAELEKLYRDRKVMEETLLVALERLEYARANQARKISTFQVLDPPALPTVPSWPKRTVIVVVATILGLAAGSGLEWWRWVRAARVQEAAPASDDDHELRAAAGR